MNTRTSGQQFTRRVNDSIYRLLVKLACEDGEFWCECSDPYCDERVTRTLREYAALGDAALFSRSHLPEKEIERCKR
jgi:hypothetical protein